MEQFKPTGRKFNDLWAAILFFIFAITVMGFSYIHTSDFMVIKKINLNLLIVHFIAVFLHFVFLLSLLILCPAFLMHVSCLSLPIISLAFAFMFQNIWGIVIACVTSVISLLIYFFIRKRIPFAAKICRESTIIIKNNFFIVYSVQSFAIISFNIMSYLFFCTFKDLKDEQNLAILSSAVLLLLLWVYFITCYSVRVMISSTIFLAFKKSFSFILAVSNLAYSFGSICFGALIVALITFLQTIVNREQGDERRSAISVILLVIFSILISILRDLVDYMNRWAFCYIALTGKPYIQGVKESFNAILSKNNSITDSYLVESILSFLNILFVILYIFSLILFGLKNIQTIEDIGTLMFLINGFLFSAFISYSIFETGVKALTFTYILDPGLVARENKELADAFEGRKRELDNSA